MRMGCARVRRWTAGLASAVLLAAGSAAGQGAVTADDRMELANGLFVRGLYDLAAKEYMELLAGATPHPKADQVLYRLAECHRRLGNAGPAQFFLKRVTGEHPQSPYRDRAEFAGAEMDCEAGRFAEAAGRFTALLQRQPTNDLAAGATYYLGHCAARQNQAEPAQDRFREVLAKFADTPYAALAALELADLYRRAGGRDEEAALYQLASTNNLPATAAEGWFQLGEFHFRRKQFKDAAAAFDRLLKEYATTPRAADARLPAAWARLSDDRFADALALADAALAATPPAAPADEWLYLKANAHRLLHDAAQAQAAYARLRKEFPESPRAAAAAYENALVAFQQKDFAGAIALASAFQPPPALQEDFYWLLAEAHTGAGHTNEAVQFLQLVAKAPQPGPRAPDALYRLGRLLQDRGDFASASDLYRTLATSFPAHEAAPAALLGSGFCLAQLNRHTDAVTDWTRIVTDHARSPLAEEALYQKALGEYRLAREPQARESMSAFLQRHPKSTYAPEIRFWHAVLLEKAGEGEAAEQELRKAIEAKPRPELAHRAQFRLAALLHRAKRADEAAALIQPLVGVSTELAANPGLVEWLARYRLDRQEWAEAAKTALLLTGEGVQKPWPALGWYLAGRARAGLPDRAGAIDAYTRASAENTAGPESAEAAQRLGDLLLEDKKYDEAATCFERAAAASSEAALAEVKARSMLGLGRIAEAREKWDDARRYYLSVAILFDHPELSPAALYRAADIFGRMGQLEPREKTLQELKTRYPQSEWTKKAGL